MIQDPDLRMSEAIFQKTLHLSKSLKKTLRWTEVLGEDEEEPSEFGMSVTE